MTREEVLDKLNGYPSNLVKISFLMVDKKSYFDEKSYSYSAHAKYWGFNEDTLDDFERTPYLALDEIGLVFIFFLNTKLSTVDRYLNVIDNQLKIWEDEDSDFIFLKKNYCDLDKKEKRIVKFIQLMNIDEK